MPTIAESQSRRPHADAAGIRGATRFAAVWNGRHAIAGALGTTAGHDAAVLGTAVATPRGAAAPALPGRATIGVLGAVAPSSAGRVLGAGDRQRVSPLGRSDAARRLRVLVAR
jgi:hypothetical protein